MSRTRPRIARASIALAVCALLGLAANQTMASHLSETEVFALNVFIKNYTFGDPPKTTILDGSWKASCQRLKKRRVPTARCWLAWDSDHAHWTAYGHFRGAVRIGPPYKSFRWRFNVKSRCVGDVCSTIDPKHRVKRRVWKGRGINAPA